MTEVLSLVRYHDHHLPCVLSALHVQDRLAGMLKPVHAVLLILDLASRNAGRERAEELDRVLGLERQHEEAV